MDVKIPEYETSQGASGGVVISETSEQSKTRAIVSLLDYWRMTVSLSKLLLRIIGGLGVMLIGFSLRFVWILTHLRRQGVGGKTHPAETGKKA